MVCITSNYEREIYCTKLLQKISSLKSKFQPQENRKGRVNTK